jgi:protein-tyrosine phosphatase
MDTTTEREVSEPVDVDATSIIPGLSQGGAPPCGTALKDLGFDVLVLCAKEYQPSRESFPGVRVFYCPLEDDPKKPRNLTQAEWDCACGTAMEVARALNDGLHVLVTCVKGINRSALITALTLNLLYGWPGRMCINYVRELRPGSLGNMFFVRILERVPAKKRTAKT